MGYVCRFTAAVFSSAMKSCVWARARCRVSITYVVVEELHDEGGHAAVDADEEVDAGQHHVGCAGHAEDEGGGVHQGGDGPPAAREETLSHWVANKELWGGGGVFWHQ